MIYLLYTVMTFELWVLSLVLILAALYLLYKRNWCGLLQLLILTILLGITYRLVTEDLRQDFTKKEKESNTGSPLFVREKEVEKKVVNLTGEKSLTSSIISIHDSRIFPPLTNYGTF